MIIALGLLVDDSIIAVEMMVVKMEAGWDRVKAAAYSYSATAMPRLTGALITVAAFMPIGFSKSTTGEYAGGIFWIVGTAVLVSWLVSGLFTPYLAVKMLPKDLGKHQAGDPYDTRFYRKLRGWIDLAIERRWWVIGATAGRPGTGAGRDETRAAAVLPRTARGPSSSSSCARRKAPRSPQPPNRSSAWRRCCRRTRMCGFFTAYTGAGAPRFYLSLNPELPNPGYAQMIVMTKDLEARERVRSRLMAMADRHIPGDLGAGNTPGARAAGRVSRCSFVSSVQIPRWCARSRVTSNASWPRVPMCVMCSSTGTTRCARCASSSTRTRCARSASLPRRWPRHADVDERSPLSQLREGEELVDIVARAVPSERLDLETLKDVNVFTRQGTVVPLSQIATRALRARRASAVAPQSRHGDHGSCRRQGRRTRRVGHRVHPAGAEGDRGASCLPAIASTWAARSRKATRPTRR